MFRRNPAEEATNDLLARMVADQIAPRGVRDRRVLDAMRRVDRAAFLPEALRSEAYDDKAVPTFLGQTISQPYIVAAMSEMLDVAQHHRVLEIGTGTGYQAAVLSLLAREVVTLERHGALAASAGERLAALGYENVRVLHRDGFEGAVEFSPFDRIMVTAGAARVPEALFAQLADGGRLVAPVAPSHQEGGEVLCRWTRRGGELVREEFFPVRFVPLIPGLPDSQK